MANEKENLEVKKKPQQVKDEELNKVNGGDYLKCNVNINGCVGSCYK